MPAPHSARPRKRAQRRKPSQEREGATLATIDGFMDLIGTRQDVPLIKPTPQNKMKGEGLPFAIKALDFVSMVFAKKAEDDRATE